MKPSGSLPNLCAKAMMACWVSGSPGGSRVGLTQPVAIAWKEGFEVSVNGLALGNGGVAISPGPK